MQPTISATNISASSSYDTSIDNCYGIQKQLHPQHSLLHSSINVYCLLWFKVNNMKCWAEAGAGRQTDPAQGEWCTGGEAGAWRAPVWQHQHQQQHQHHNNPPVHNADSTSWSDQVWCIMQACKQICSLKILRYYETISSFRNIYIVSPQQALSQLCKILNARHQSNHDPQQLRVIFQWFYCSGSIKVHFHIFLPHFAQCHRVWIAPSESILGLKFEFRFPVYD